MTNKKDTVKALDFSTLQEFGAEVSKDLIEKECSWVSGYETVKEDDKEVKKEITQNFKVYIKCYNAKEWLEFADHKKDAQSDRMFRLIAGSLMDGPKSKTPLMSYEKACGLKLSFAMCLFNAINEVNNDTEKKH